MSGNRGYCVLSEELAFPFPVLFLIYEECDYHEYIAYRLRQHKHSEHGNDSGGNSYRYIEEEGEKNVQPEELKCFLFVSFSEKQDAYHGAEEDERNVSYYSPCHVA